MKLVDIYLTSLAGWTLNPQKSSRIRRDHNGSHGQQDQGRHSRRNWEHGFLNRECAVEVTRAIRKLPPLEIPNRAWPTFDSLRGRISLL